MGKVTHAASKRSAALGELVAIAATLPVPAKGELRFKKPEEYRYIGKDVPIVDQHNIVTGKAVFGMDAKRPGMLYAVGRTAAGVRLEGQDVRRLRSPAR